MFGRNKEEIQKDFDVFAIYDSKVGSYDMPMFAMNEHDLTREIMNHFRDASKRSQNKFYINAEDYSLFKIGAYSKKAGKLITHDAQHVANLHELKAVIDQREGIVPTW